MEVEQDHMVMSRRYRGQEGDSVTPYKTLGKLSDILHLNNRNNQLKRRARSSRNVPLDA